MEFKIIIEIISLGVALSMDAFAVSVTSGLIYQDINKKKSFFIAFVFGFMQALMPLIGYFLVEIVTNIVGEQTGGNAGSLISVIVTWIAFTLLLIIGGKMIIESVKELKAPLEEKNPKLFSIKEVLYFGFATAIDALGSGVALHSGLSTNTTIWLHVGIIMAITFVISLVGLFLGGKIEKLFKGKIELTGIIGGIILIGLAVWIVLSYYLGV